MSAFDEQVGGDHYLEMAIQPAEFSIKNRLGGAEYAVIKYVCRWNRKGGKGLQDLEKARHTLDLLIEIERGRATAVVGKGLDEKTIERFGDVVRDRCGPKGDADKPVPSKSLTSPDTSNAGQRSD